MGVLHIYGTFFYRKYATPKKFPQQNWQMWVIFCQSESHFFWDISKLPNLKDLSKTSTKKNSQRTQERFFRNYATLFIGGRCIFTEITVLNQGISATHLLYHPSPYTKSFHLRRDQTRLPWAATGKGIQGRMRYRGAVLHSEGLEERAVKSYFSYHCCCVVPGCYAQRWQLAASGDEYSYM